ncbi:PilZ domain-containing protein [Billgrantia aerodenitrificans]|uniref:Metal-dependent phosphohydrolase n=1 Tax=Billgrantia aerodenitrificans TaxID=2733483 RepID=A0ABS9AVG4_9GAMM|nr:PilZ domain-containing protein [Halomonas aerodenitrificans]MCE8025857.1 metal-dependent phosphohydrolase [Halomonas aerodenitrificans]
MEWKTTPALSNQAIRTVGRIFEGSHDITIFSDTLAQPLSAQVASLNPASKILTLRVFCPTGNIDDYMPNGLISFDLEKMNRDDSPLLLCFEKVQATHERIYSNLFEIRCVLADSLLITVKPGGVRVPFLLGMSASVMLDVFSGSLAISARLCNLSLGGCRLEVPLEKSMPLTIHQQIPNIHIQFPNGEGFRAKGSIRNMRPFGCGRYMAVGIRFIDLDRETRQRLLYFITESEVELARRLGMENRRAGISSLFLTSTHARKPINASNKRNRLPPMAHAVKEVARQQHIILHYLKNERPFPESILYEGADSLLHLAESDRHQFLYTLRYVGDEATWVRHSVRVAALLGDILLTQPGMAGDAREAIAGILLHAMGKPLLVSEQLPSLDINLRTSQKDLLKHHVKALHQQLHKVGWSPGPVLSNIINDINERLDGSGYPTGKTKEALSKLVRTASVIKIIDTLTHARNGRPALSPLDAYRWVYGNGGYDRQCLNRYVRRYGLYPVGSLVKYSGGFLAWVMRLGREGSPSQVRVVKNLAFEDSKLDTVLSDKDIQQLGKLEAVVDPADFQL